MTLTEIINGSYMKDAGLSIRVHIWKEGDSAELAKKIAAANRSNLPTEDYTEGGRNIKSRETYFEDFPKKGVTTWATWGTDQHGRISVDGVELFRYDRPVSERNRRRMTNLARADLGIRATEEAKKLKKGSRFSAPRVRSSSGLGNVAG